MIGVRVPGSTSNLGAGFDFLGIAVDLWLEAKLLDGSGDPVYSGTLDGFDPASEIIAQWLAEGADFLSKYRLEVHSDIPVARGLGSSAAARAAGHALSQLAAGHTLDRNAVFQNTSDGEGHPDNAGPAVFGGAILAAGSPIEITVNAGLALAFAVPETAMDTKAARALLPEMVSRADAIAQASHAATLALGLQRGDQDLIRRGMEDRLAVPYRQNLIVGFDAARNAGHNAGAFGVTISGAGSAMVAVTDKAGAGRVARAMAQALTTSGNPASPLKPRMSKIGLTVIG